MEFYHQLRLTFIDCLLTLTSTWLKYDVYEIFVKFIVLNWDIYPLQQINISETTERLFYLMEHDHKLFTGKLIHGAVIEHNVPLEGNQRKFEIIEVIHAKKWEHFDEDH